jgi:hypothetical protein
VPRRYYAPLTLPRITADPSDSEEGSIWYRSDTGQLLLDDGAPAAAKKITIGPNGNLPIVTASQWHSLPPYGAPATMTPTNNRAYALPAWPGRKATLTGVAAEVTLLGVGNLRAGLYTSNPTTSLPNTLLADFGTVSTGAAGVKQWDSLSQSLRAVLYWLVIVQQGAITVGLRARDTWDPIVSDTTPVLNSNRNAYYSDTGFAGALPASFGSIAGTIQGPAAMLQLT